jgi:hypothetical protein
MTVLSPDMNPGSACSWCSRVRSVASRFQLPIGPKILLDVRETTNRRGYHLLAAAAIMAPHLGRCRLYAMSTDHAEEHLAMNAFRFDTGRKLSIWNPKKKRRWWRKPVFDLYLMISDDWPTDKRTKKARRRSRRFLLGLHLPVPPGDGEAVVTSGADTRAFAGKVLALLGLPSRLTA